MAFAAWLARLPAAWTRPAPPAAATAWQGAWTALRTMSFKTKSAAKKRFRLTGGGTFKHARAGRQHLATGDSRQTIRELGKTAYVTATDRKVLFKLIQKP